MIAIYEQYIEYRTIMGIFHDPPKVEYGLVGAVFCGEPVGDIIVRTIDAGTDLFPDTVFHLFKIIRMHQITELAFCKMHEIIEV